MEQETRETAIKRFIQGEKPKQIYESLNRSNPWFFKWLKRYQSGEPNWFKGQSNYKQLGGSYRFVLSILTCRFGLYFHSIWTYRGCR